MAEDEEDDGFGDFAFVSFPTQTHTNDNGKDDDEWGDFVESPLQSLAASQTQSSPIGTFGDPFWFSSSDHQIRVESAPSEVGSGKAQWGKQKGALPLSIFGEEEEEESSVADPSVGNGKDSFPDNKRTGNSKNESNAHLGVGMNETIAHLYSQNQQIKDEYGLKNSNDQNLNSNESNLNANGTSSDSSGVNLDMNGSIINLSGLNADLCNQIEEEAKNENGMISTSFLNGSSSHFGVFHFEFNGTNLNLKDPVSTGVNFDTRNSIRNFAGFDSTSGNINRNISQRLSNQSGEIKSENGLIFHSSGPDSNSKVPSSNFGGWDLNISMLDSNVEPVGGNEEEDDGWEFKDASAESKGNVAIEISGFQVQLEAKMGQDMQVQEHGSHGQIDLFAMPNGFSSKTYDMDIGVNFKPTTAQNGFISNSYLQGERKNMENWSISHPLAQNDDFGETFGEFEAAFSDTGSKQEMQALPSVTKSSSESGNGSHGNNDIFAMPNGFSSKSYDIDFAFNLEPKLVAQNGAISDFYLQIEQKDVGNGLNSHPLVENDDPDESFGEFEAAVSDTGSKQDVNEAKSETHKGPMPLSIFGLEDLETDSSFSIQDTFISKASANSGNVHSRSPSLSINDILTSLYRQAEPISSVEFMHKTTENELDSTKRGLSSDSVDDDDDFDDGSWEFKEAISQSGAKNETYLLSVEDEDQSFPTGTKMNFYLDFYCKLKDKSCLVARCHLDSLKKAQSAAALSGEVAKAEALDEEIQEACKKLYDENIMSNAADADDHPPREIDLSSYLEVLREPKFQLLDSEYELSRKLSLAENDLKSAIDLIEHASGMIKILTVVSAEEQANYVSTWSQMFSICAQELKHGAWIWKQSLEKNVQSRVLSEPQGKQFILALGEIYRVALVLGTSVKLYKPWILSSSVNSTGIYALLEECQILWSCSGLEEALRNMSVSEYNVTPDTSLASIKRINDTDAHALENYDFAQQENVCLLSGLTPGMVPDMKMVVWNGDHYFLPLANLWANLINSDPPNLGRINGG